MMTSYLIIYLKYRGGSRRGVLGANLGVPIVGLKMWQLVDATTID